MLLYTFHSVPVGSAENLDAKSAVASGEAKLPLPSGFTIVVECGLRGFFFCLVFLAVSRGQWRRAGEEQKKKIRE